MGRKKNDTITSESRVPQNNHLNHQDALNIVLLNPRIPQNTGAIARLCAATKSNLHLVAPLFKIDDKKLIRAGLDYWPLLNVKHYASEDDFIEEHKDKTHQFWLAETKSEQLYTEVSYKSSDFILFGDEQAGISDKIFNFYKKSQHISLPQTGVRSLNLAMAVGIVCFEAYRQLNWKPFYLK